ncbi:class I SAM-dependent methyltransferase [Massilia sp. RP-1-19]|uniref:Class I SAM-dependent methyltransferase n=1 Tax=Massilia polaris TaxID=2728846 RepID=A0A848HMF8_9BURK|nr:class I SAM-dependent methyltransferase [Massilia polaris]NML62404.1 class I SAM-dependent methyltransferase [Massilia polaris]
MNSHAAAPVSAWVARFAPLAPQGEVLDLACGSGRHARHFAALGHPVLAVDRDPVALAEAAGQGITAMAFDLEDPALAWPFEAGRFAAIVVTNYLHRPLFGYLAASLRGDGLLIYETFALGNEAFGKPSNPAFLLEHGELLMQAAAHGLKPIAYEDGYVESPKPAMVQRLFAAKEGFAWASARLERGVAPI